MAAARQHFEEGTKAYTAGEFERAAHEYQAAYDAEPDAELLYNIAQAHRLGHNPERALFFYRTYLERQPNASNRGEIEQWMRELNAEIVVISVPQPQMTMTTIANPEFAAPVPRPHKPLYKKGWFWGTMAGIAVAVGVGVGLGVGLTRSDVPGSGLGNQKVFSLGISR